MFLLLLNLLSLCSFPFIHNYTAGKYQQDNFRSINYIMPFPEERYSQFSTTHEPFYIVGGENGNQTLCETKCNDLFSCKGYTYFSQGEDNYRCNLLSNLGEEEHVKTEAYSWEKLVHYNNFF